MGIFSFHNKKNPFFSLEENKQIVEAIRLAEQVTSGEIRVMVESHCSYVDALDRAGELFFKLEMDETDDKNAVLIYVAVKDKQFAIFADENIHAKAGTDFWNSEAQKMIIHFKENNIAAAIAECIEDVGTLLQNHFPYKGDADKNELPDEIIFGN